MSCLDLDTVLGTGINVGCPLPVTGAEYVGYIGIKSEILSKANTGNIFTSIIMKPTKKMFPITVKGTKPYDPKITGKAAAYGWVFDQTTGYTIKGHNPSTANLVKGLADEKMFMILQQVGVTGNGKYMVFGLETGLIMTASALEIAGEAGGTVVTMSEMNTDNSGNFLYSTSDDATDTLVSTLATAAA